MRRIIVALFAMVAGTTLLVGLKGQSLPAAFPLSAEGPVDPGGGGDPPAPAGSSGPTDGAGPAAGPTDTATTPPESAGANPTTAAPPVETSTTDSAPGVSGTFTGMAVDVTTAQSPNARSRPCGDCHDYSTAVTITVSNGQITDVSVAYNPGPAESQRYADRATNSLRPKLLSAQSWQLGNVSGATYSANAFELSVQDAMNQAGLAT
jgi:FMN-binding domain